jgi:pimeloyl-ACP methyl ester carboxylesterase
MAKTEELESKVTAEKAKTKTKLKSKATPAIEFAHQAERLAQYTVSQENDTTGSTQAVEAKFITAQDPVIETADGGRLPAVPLDEALKLNQLKGEIKGRDPDKINGRIKFGTREAKDGTIHGVHPPDDRNRRQPTDAEGPLSHAVPPARTNPLFPPLPMYGPPTLLRNVQCRFFQVSSSILSLCFLAVIVLGAFFTSIPLAAKDIGSRLLLRNPAKKRVFYDEEVRRSEARKKANQEWTQSRSRQSHSPRRRTRSTDEEQDGDPADGRRDPLVEDYVSTEGGQDALVCDIAYYARRVGLDCETYLVQTEDGFIIELWHLFNPLTQTPKPESARQPNSPDIFTNIPSADAIPPNHSRYPVLLIHGLLQSSGAYCCTDESSLAFYLAKSGLDVWLGNNRCGFHPRHVMLKPSDPRMWAWNIRQMGVMDLPALITRILSKTGFPKLALVAHSQGTTQTLVALAKEQRPEIGTRISVACLLAPAAYAGPLIGKMYFKFMRVISPGMFRAIFGIHAFIPFMMRMHGLLPARFYGFMGYRVFSFLFNWTDSRWERELRARCFQFAPVYVSSESMRWWLGRECFAKQKCILATREEGKLEDQEDGEEEGEDADQRTDGYESHVNHRQQPSEEERRRFAWYDENVPPLALWVAGSDDLVDGRRLLRRFERGREPFVDIVHQKVIPEYEHLDVIWAVDSIEQVGREVLETIWKTVPDDLRANSRVPIGCQNVEIWKSERDRKRQSQNLDTDGMHTVETSAETGRLPN